jgi:hypothetical protein
MLVQQRETDKECHADHVLDTFDIGVEINLRVHLLDLSNRLEEICERFHELSSPFSFNFSGVAKQHQVVIS